MTIEATQWRDGAILVLVPRGRIAAPDIEDFERSIRSRIHNGDHNIIIDLEEVEAIDAAGVRTLVAIAASLVVQSGKLVLCGLANNLLKLFRLTACDQVVLIVDSYEEAVESFQRA